MPFSPLLQGFDPNAALFAATSDNKLYPNPAAGAMVGEAPQLLDFLGRMLGKALFEGILLELPLAGFFLKQLRPGAWCSPPPPPPHPHTQNNYGISYFQVQS